MTAPETAAVPDNADDALRPLRDALVARACAKADAMRAAAEAEGQQAISEARAEADTLLSSARAAGESDAAALHAVVAGRARQAARSVVLEAQRTAYDSLRARAGDAVRALLGNIAIRDRLAASIRDQLGPDAVVVAAPSGGLRATVADGRSIDASTEALVEQAIAGIDLERLWAAS